MASKARAQRRRAKTTTQTEYGMVIRALREDPQSDAGLLAMVQMIGERRFDKKKIEELSGGSQHSWISFNRSVAQAQHKFSAFVELLEEVVEEARDADLELIAAEIDDLVRRREADELRAAAKRQREEEERTRDEAFFRLEIEDIEQELDERKANHLQKLAERSARQKIQFARDAALLALAIFCVLTSGALIVIGAVNEKPLVAGGASVVIAIAGLIKMFFFGWRTDISLEEGDLGGPTNRPC